MQCQHDNTAIVTRDFLNQNQINTFTWPSLSPDLNPMKFLWGRVDRDICSQIMQPRSSPHKLVQVVMNAWNRVAQMACLSMSRRNTAVVATNGSHTRYLF